MSEAARLRHASRILASVPYERRVDACAKFHEAPADDVDPVGRVLDGHRDADGVRRMRVTAPLGVIGMTEPDVATVAAAVAAGNAVALLATEGESGDAGPFDLASVGRGLTSAGLPEHAVLAVASFAEADVDAVLSPDGIVVAERTGSHRHVYVDADADRTWATYIVVNAAVTGAADTVLFHADFPDWAVRDATTSLTHMELEMTLARAANIAEAGDVIDRRSSGEVETVLASGTRILHDLERRIDAAVLCENVSPAFAGADLLTREVIGFTRTRMILDGDGQTKAL